MHMCNNMAPCRAVSLVVAVNDVKESTTLTIAAVFNKKKLTKKFYNACMCTSLQPGEGDGGQLWPVLTAVPFLFFGFGYCGVPCSFGYKS